VHAPPQTFPVDALCIFCSVEPTWTPGQVIVYDGGAPLA
jgi:hypothetical protein